MAKRKRVTFKVKGKRVSFLARKLPKRRVMKRVKKRASSVRRELKGLTRLPAYSAIFVPSTYKGRPISTAAHKQRIRAAAKFYTTKFGGSTRYRGFGTWKVGKKVVGERVGKVESYAVRKKFSKSKLVQWVRRMKKKWGQDSVAIEVENRKGDRDLYFV